MIRKDLHQGFDVWSWSVLSKTRITPIWIKPLIIDPKIPKNFLFFFFFFFFFCKIWRINLQKRSKWCVFCFQVLCVGVGFVPCSSNDVFCCRAWRWVQMLEAPTRRPCPGRFEETDDPVPKICFIFLIEISRVSRYFWRYKNFYTVWYFFSRSYYSTLRNSFVYQFLKFLEFSQGNFMKPK